METKVATVQWKIQQLTEVINVYKWLIDAYVVDFYVEDYWSKIPTSWQSLEKNSLSNLKLLFPDFKIPKVPNKQSKRLTNDNSEHCVLPLSLLVIKILDRQLCVPRVNNKPAESCPQTNDMNKKNLALKKIKNELKRRVKPKKLHEVSQILPICKSLSEKCSVSTVIDFGSGLGHLARHLAYICGLNVCCIEQQTKLVDEARKIDREVCQKYSKYEKNSSESGMVLHVNKCLMKDTDFDEILTDKMQTQKVGLIGLHPCGDLANLLLKIFLKQNEIKFMIIVGCCYMKLTTEATHLMEGRKPSKEFSYPMSTYLKGLGKNSYNLSYEALELAPHAIEKYLTESSQNNFTSCKIHSYRAVLEQIIIKHWPDKKHAGLKSVRYVPELSFEEYCKKAVSGMEITIPETDIQADLTEKRLKDWKRVVIFYTFRQVFASFIESLILYDRQLFLLESSIDCEIMPVFDPLTSSRCHITRAIKPT